MQNKTIHQLRLEGYKVRVKHQRYKHVRYSEFLAGTNLGQKDWFNLVPIKELPGKERFPRGGETTVEITTPDGRNYAATSKCHINDNFDRKLAVRICLGRIEKQAAMDKNVALAS